LIYSIFVCFFATRLISDSLGNCPTFLDNDAKAAALAEWWVGAGKGASIQNMVVMTVGTGIGSAIISEGQLIRGANGMAGEVGHAIVEINGEPDPRTGVRGILEKYAAAPASEIWFCLIVFWQSLQTDIENAFLWVYLQTVLSRAKAAAATQPTSPLLADDLSCKDVFDLVEMDDIASQVVMETAEYIAVACINMCRHVDPDVIVLTGGVTNAGNALLSQVQSKFAMHHWNVTPINCQIILSALSNQAGCIGAAAVAKQGLTGSMKDWKNDQNSAVSM
jgi:glucokinase